MRKLLWFIVILMLLSAGARKAPADNLPANMSGLIGSVLGQSWKPKQPPLTKFAPLSSGVPDLTPWRAVPPSGESFHPRTPPQPQPRVIPSPLPHKKGERYA
jgi:hypothetical protein